ncbi:MAG: response regulator transcription factor [Pseudomonadales bacterium]
MRLLLIEDHRDIAGVIFDYFEALNYQLDYAADGQQGLHLASNNRYDIILLDVMLPRIDGITLCKTLREQAVDTPILMLTARDSREDILQGFGAQADDYVVKPFDLPILHARIEALVRRKNPSAHSKALNIGELQLDLSTHSASRAGRTLNLTPTGFSILSQLAAAAPNTVSKQDLSYQLWGDEPPEGDILRNHIYQLRCELDKPFAQAMLLTVARVGYRLQNTEQAL